MRLRLLKSPKSMRSVQLEMHKPPDEIIEPHTVFIRLIIISQALGDKLLGQRRPQGLTLVNSQPPTAQQREQSNLTRSPFLNYFFQKV